MIDKNTRILVAGHRGLVGRSLVWALQRKGYQNLVLASRSGAETTDRKGLRGVDFRDPAATFSFIDGHHVEAVFLAAAHVGGIAANDGFPCSFILNNLQIQNSIVSACIRAGVKKLVFFGSSCIYPRDAEQPIKESALLTGPLETTNEPYAVAKIAGIKLVQAARRQHGLNGICIMPPNLYGPNDNYDLMSSHVVAALIRKFYEGRRDGAPTVTVWGTGAPKREFLFANDLGRAAVMLFERYDDPDVINVGTGSSVSIARLAEMIALRSNYKGKIVFDHSKPDGTPEKRMDVTRIFDMGWRPQADLDDGLRVTCAAYEGTSKLMSFDGTDA